MLRVNHDFEACVKASERVSWRVDEVLPPGTKLDFDKNFLPGMFAGGKDLAFLDEGEKRKLNQICGHAYLNLFAFVEEYIQAVMVNHAHAELFGDHTALRALTRFADEEVKHQELFHRYMEAFAQDFTSPCGVIGSAGQVAAVILSKSPIAVMMVTLHIEIMTQGHYIEAIKDDQSLDPLFTRLLHHHWLEESQHAKIDLIELDKLLVGAGEDKITKAFEDYLALIEAFDGLLLQQAKLDVDSLSRATGREFSPEEATAIEHTQHAAYRRTFLVYGMTHRQFVEVLQQISPGGAADVASRSRALAA